MERISVDFEVKQLHLDDDDFFRFEGLASTFGNIDLVGDIVERGAFTESLAKETPVILWQHDSHEPIGMPEEIKETPEGLFIRVKLPKDDHLVKSRVMPQMKVGSIRKMSIGFNIDESIIDANDIRHLQRVTLKEVSLVTFPANPKAEITGFKNVNDVKEIKTVRDFEKALRESGAFSKEAAVLLAKFFQGEPVEDHKAKKVSDELAAFTKHVNDAEAGLQIKNMIDKLEASHG